MKKILLACCLGAAVVAAHAQPQHPGPDEGQRLTYLQKSLQLSDDQAQKLKPILENSAEQKRAVMQKYKPQFEAMRTDMKNVDQQTHSQLATVLTPAQLQAFDAQHEARKHFGGKHGRFGGPRPDARPDAMMRAQPE